MQQSTIYLENQALLEQIKRNNNKFTPPILIEISGTPNSGKTSVLSNFSSILERKGINHSVFYESARDCKIKDKRSPSYNYWTACDTIQKLIQVVNEPSSIILCERGIFDAITWLNFHYNHKSITEKDFIIAKNFYLMQTHHFSHTYVLVMKCSAECSIQREYSINDYHLYGTIVNPMVLEELNSSIEQCKQQYSTNFHKLDVLDTTDYDMDLAMTTAFHKLLTYINDTPEDIRGNET